jgi:hypothetical protein
MNILSLIINSISALVGILAMLSGASIFLDIGSGSSASMFGWPDGIIFYSMCIGIPLFGLWILYFIVSKIIGHGFLSHTFGFYVLLAAVVLVGGGLLVFNLLHPLDSS